MAFHQIFKSSYPPKYYGESVDGLSELEKETSDRDVESDAQNFNYDVDNNSISTALFHEADAVELDRRQKIDANAAEHIVRDESGAKGTSASSGGTLKAPTKFFSRSSIDGDAEDNLDEEEKHDVESEKHLKSETITADPKVAAFDPNNDLSTGDMKMDSILVQRAFEVLKKENSRLIECLEQERRKTIMLKPRYEYLEGHFIEYVQKREEYIALIDQMQEQNAESPALKPATVSIETQTWKGIICGYCSKTHEIANNKLFKDFVECQTKNAVCISSQSYQELERKFKDLKDAVRVRESIYENRTERAEIINLKAALAQAQAELAHVLRKNKHGQFCLETLQRIVVKLTASGDDLNIECLTAQEQNWIDRIVSKFHKHPVKQSIGSISLTPSAIDFTQPHGSMACLHPTAVGDANAAAGDF